ncbi:HD family phosphohydrolase [Trichloromonas sp.]|uniref:HD family phosphohydrolase n=1 Tax=Trichloromonas sp. TaxID=3069249 RepID=UPI002A406399|nr:HDIG domain-containing protein [Trichloromonas sp.]
MNKNDSKSDSSSRKSKIVEKSFWRQERAQRYLMLAFLALFLTVIIVPKGGFIPDHYSPGDIATRDVKSPRELLIPDLVLTESKRVEAEGAVLPLYDYDSRAGQAAAETLAQGLQLVEQAAVDPEMTATLGDDLENFLEVELTAEDRDSLKAFTAEAAARETAAPLDLAPIRQAVISALEGRIVGNLQLFQGEAKHGILMRDLHSRQEILLQQAQEVIGVGNAQDRLREELRPLDLSRAQRRLIQTLAVKLVSPNLTFNKNETEARKQQAREEVKPVLFQVKKGEMIVREGERVTEEQIRKLRGISELGSHSNTLVAGIGFFLSIVVLFFATHRFARVNIRKYAPDNRDLLFLVVNFIVLFVLVKFGIFVSSALESAFPYIDSNSYYYVLPFAFGAMLARIVLNSEVAFVFAILSSLLLGALFGYSLYISVYALAGSVTSAHWVRHCKQRTTLYRAGFHLSLVNMLMIVGLYLISGQAFDVQLLYKIGFGLAGGFLCAILVTGTIPLVEHLFEYTTDIKLLELANMNTPILRELMIQAPGTYHHSVIVGNLVEAAAESINANPLLARVAAYYHDIGKIRKPLYFVENMNGQENRHDKLAPSMSALILMSHVKDAVEMARENKLGAPIIDIIRQHHGTALMKFFYDKAKSKEEPGMPAVDERDYRYPGPKPQTREAALIMLADAVEAASRTLSDPTPARIQGMVQKIINNIFIDGQLDECELTLKDLHRIARSFNRILAGIFHHRIDYPEPAYKERDKDAAKRKNGEDSDRESAKEAKGKETVPAKSGTEDLKRLGMS